MAQLNIANCTLPALSGTPVQPQRLESSRPFILVDGLNLIRVQNHQPKLTNLLTVVLHLAENGWDFGCAFDANTRHVLRESGRVHDAEAYEYFLSEYRDFFVEVTGRTRADELILAEADARSAPIVSNDLFRKYKGQYPWVTEAGRVLRVNQFRGNLHFDGFRLQPLQKLHKAVRAVENLIGNF